MTLKHLRSSTLNKRPQPSGMADGQLAMNTASGSPGLFFKDADGSLVKIGPVHVGTVAPNVSPASGGTTGNSLGEQWLDTSGGTYVFKIWDGTAWRSESGEFVNTSGDTMTGSLTMGPSASVIFEGSIDDGFETTLTVINPTVDRIITLPNVSGTIITSGDTGTVTSTMIANDTIVDADINSAAAIAGTKISPNFGGQNIVTSGTFIHALASSGAPSITFTGDTNTGIYSPGADQIAISTGGGQRIYIDSAGAVRIGSAGTLAASDRLLIYESGVTTRSTVASIENPTLGDGHAAFYDVTANTAGGSERRAYLAVQKQAGQTNPCAVLYMGTQDGANNYHWIDDNDDLRIGTNAQVGTTGGSRYAKDYEEGTWTPTVVGTTTAGTATYSTRVGTYTKVGNMVTIFLEVTWSSGTGTGNLRVTGLPFVSNSNYVTALGASSNLTYTSGQTPYAFTSSSSNINIGVSATGVGAASLAYDAAASLFLTLTYFV